MNTIIIVAGGKGERMGQEIPKQFIPIGGKPVLMHTIESFFKYDNTIRIVVALSALYKEYWSNLCKSHNFSIKHEVVDGGKTRFHSVKNALESIEGGIVAVHDAARPFVSTELIKRCFQIAAKYQSAIPVLEVTDSLRELTDNGNSKIVNRSLYRTVQTPQVFDSNLLKNAYKLGYTDSFTDDASVVEVSGSRVYLVEGEKNNIKITTPFDLELARVIMNNRG